jgi:hypothetical protein
LFSVRQAARSVEGSQRLVETGHQLFPAIEVPVQVDLGEEEGEVLEVLEPEDAVLLPVPPLGDLVPIAKDIEVVALQPVLLDVVGLVDKEVGELVEVLAVPVAPLTLVGRVGQAPSARESFRRGIS